MVYSGAWGKLIQEKNQKQKISWHCPFNLANVPYNDLVSLYASPIKDERNKDVMFLII